MTGYTSWDEAKKAIMDKTADLLAIGDEKGVESLSFGFEVDYNLFPYVRYEVKRALLKEEGAK